MRRKKRVVRKKPTDAREQRRSWVTKTGYKIRVDTVSPLVVAELRKKFGLLNIQPFTYTHVVPESGAKIPFVYVLPEERDPPEAPPTQEDPMYLIYQECLAYWREIQRKQAEYRVERNDLVLASAVTVLGHRTNHNWKATLNNGKWISDLQAGGIKVTSSKKQVLFLKARVLKNEADYLKVLDLAVPEEVTMADVKAAWDRFQHLIRRVSAIAGGGEITRREHSNISAFWADSHGSGPEPELEEQPG